MKILDKVLLGIVGLGLGVSPVLAATTDTGANTTDLPQRLTALGPILDRIMNLLFPLAGLVCVVFIIIGGYMWITSAGDPSKIKQAQSTLTWAIIGLVFILLAVAIIKVITTFVVS